MKRFFDGVNLLLALTMVVFALWGWPRLPHEIPVHFGIDGRPDAWGERTVGSWFMIPGLGLALTLGMGWFRRMLPRRPGCVNLPDKTKLSDLPVVARGPVVEMLAGFLALVQTEVLVIFLLIQFSTFRGAMGQDSRGIMILVLLIAILSSPFFLVVFFLRLQGAMDRATALAEGADVYDGAEPLRNL